MKRRTFILNTSLVAAGSLAFWQCTVRKLAAGHKNSIGLQLYTVRDAMKEDAIGTLKTLSAMGYREVENAGYFEGKYYNMPLKEFRKVLDDNGLKMRSGHTQTGAKDPNQKRTMINQWEAACEDAANIGQQYLVLAYLHDFERKSLDDYKRMIELLNTCAVTASNYGLSMLYHNHEFEFMPIEGKVPYDMILAQTDRKLVNFELDLYWVKYAGKDCLEYFRQHSGRFPLWHVKDMDKTKDRYFAEVGQGIIYWQPIFEAQETAGLKQFYVEQDFCKNHLPLESVKISIDYVKKEITG